MMCLVIMHAHGILTRAILAVNQKCGQLKRRHRGGAEVANVWGPLAKRAAATSLFHP
jgi:hypothetical protein